MIPYEFDNLKTKHVANLEVGLLMFLLCEVVDYFQLIFMSRTHLEMFTLSNAALIIYNFPLSVDGYGEMKLYSGKLDFHCM